MPTKARLAARAVRHKVRAMATLGALWPAAVRGGRLLARGRFREFAAKLLKETSTVRAFDAAPRREGPPLVLAGHILRLGGYDHVVYSLLKGLIESGVNVGRDPDSVLSFDLIPHHLRPSEPGESPQAPRIVATPPHLLPRFRPDRRTAAFTMWETDTLPSGAVAAMNRCGLVIVPSRWGKEAFERNGVTVPIEVVPLGHDSAFASPGSTQADVERITAGPITAGPITFGTAGALDGGGLRKNIPLVVALFRQAFPTEPDVRLRVKITPASPPIDTQGDPRIEVLAHSLSTEELARWYRSLTAYVNGSFGEGFGLHLLESMACGTPLVSTSFGGAGEFFDGAVGYEIGYRLVEARNAIYTGRWADPRASELIASLKQIHKAPEEARRRGTLAAARASRFTWEKCIERLLEALARHRLFGPLKRP